MGGSTKGMAPNQTAQCRLVVALKPGVTIEAWLILHDGKKRHVTLVSDLGDRRYLVDVEYTARGADYSDLMRPYRQTAIWRKLADVARGGKTTITRHDT